VTIEFSQDSSSKDDLSLEGGANETFNHDETSRSVIQSKLISMLESEIQALKLENQKLRIRLNDHEVSPSSPTSDPVNAARRRMQTKPRAYLACEHEADTITAVHLNGRFTTRYQASLDPVDICMIDDDNHYRDSFSPQDSRAASHTAVSQVRVNLSQHMHASHNFQTSSGASRRTILSTTGSHVRDAANQNNLLAARMRNRVEIYKMANLAASTEMGIGSSGSLQFKSRARSLYDQA
jgi:hypothetical protein